MSTTLHNNPASLAAHAAHATKPTEIAAPSPWLAMYVLCWREIVRFFRQRNRVIGAVGQPVLFWLLFGVGLNRSFQLGGANSPNFLEYYFPGSLMLILLFTAIFATISIIEDRREGLLQAVLVAPCPRWSMVLGKVLGGTLIALFQGLIFLALALLLKVSIGVVALGLLIVLMFVSAVALTSLGVVIAWRMESTQGFHAIMSVLLLPMWLLSGAFFPVPSLGATATASEIGLHWLMRLNPLTYAVAGARHLVAAADLGAAVWMPGAATCWLVTCTFAVVMFSAAWWIAGQRTRGDAQ
jgi:ABC-2 type transport system permease protein